MPRPTPFAGLKAQPPDPLLSLIKLFRDDPRAHKIELGVGVYRDEAGATPVLRAVKAAELQLLETQSSKSYLGPEGDVGFAERLMKMVFGASGSGATALFGMQTPGGTGAVRLAAEFPEACQARRAALGGSADLAQPRCHSQRRGPATATVLREDLERVFHADPFIHISTFGGAEPGCLVAKRVLEISSAPGFLAHVNALAAAFRAGVAGLAARHRGFLTGLRQLGLLMGLELRDERCGPVLTRTAYDHDLLLVYANHDTSVGQLLPPLVMPLDDVPWVLERLDLALREARRLVGGASE